VDGGGNDFCVISSIFSSSLPPSLPSSLPPSLLILFTIFLYVSFLVKEEDEEDEEEEDEEDEGWVFLSTIKWGRTALSTMQF